MGNFFIAWEAKDETSAWMDKGSSEVTGAVNWCLYTTAHRKTFLAFDFVSNVG